MADSQDPCREALKNIVAVLLDEDERGAVHSVVLARAVYAAERALAQHPAGLTDEQIEQAFKRHGGKWDGSRWVIEDADLHPFVRSISAPKEPAC